MNTCRIPNLQSRHQTACFWQPQHLNMSYKVKNSELAHVKNFTANNLCKTPENGPLHISKQWFGAVKNVRDVKGITLKSKLCSGIRNLLTMTTVSCLFTFQTPLTVYKFTHNHVNTSACSLGLWCTVTSTGHNK
jgi:hypothetical protein